eukprot:Nk52_evm7s426 gene=Nk52_evmTU7s426
MWIRQEYKSNKDRFEKPFFLATPSSSGAVGKLKFIQSYAGLGTTVWDGAIALARLFDNQCGGGGGGEREVVLPFSVEGKSVIEMGAGCGLVGIYLQKCHGAKCVVLTDQEISQFEPALLVVALLTSTQVLSGVGKSICEISLQQFALVKSPELPLRAKNSAEQ